jgi:pimeloyl-ACP methyl ester carboxylesterase
LQNNFDFGPNTSLAVDKLSIGGHSFGGMTALSMAEKDLRIKACFTFDPWLYARLNDIMTDQMHIT